MTVIPADSTGAYPALTGYTPMQLGRRIGVAIVDVVIIYAVYALSVLIMLGVRNQAGAFLGMGVLVALVVAEFWALFGRSARLSGVFMNAVYVDVQTGRPAPGKIILKGLLQYVLSLLTCGIAPIIIVLASVQPPLQRNWFDRTVGLMLVDARTGRQPAGSADAPGYPAMTAPPAYPTPAAPPMAAYPTPTAPPVTAYPTPTAPPASMPAPEPMFIPPPPDLPVAAEPLFMPPPATEPWLAEPEYLRPAVIQSVPEMDADDYTRPAFAAYRPSVIAQLDDGTALSLTPPTVLGRNPQAPATHPMASALSVSDPSMETSKTHLIVGEENSRPWVIDLHSANGVYVTEVGSPEPVRLAPGERRMLDSGSTISFGSRRIRIH